MIIQVLNITRWEWYKLRHRWMPWVLLGIALLYTQLVVWGAFAFYKVSDIGATELLTLPSSIDSVLGMMRHVNVFLVIILASSTIGVEYAWGTLRPTLSKGPGRWQWLASQGLMVSLLAMAALLIACLGIALSSLVASVFVQDSGALGGGGGPWGASLATLGKQIFALAPWITLAGFFTVLTTSSRIGAALALGYYFGEQVVVSILNLVYDGSQKVTQFMLGPSVSAWLSSGDAVGIGPEGMLARVAEGPGVLVAFLVIAAYTVILAGATLWVFLQRDVGGPRGA